MEWTAAPDRMTASAVGVLAMAVGALGLLAGFNALWHHAGSAAALDANEDIALLAWILGWCLLVNAAVAVAVWLIAVVRNAHEHRRASLANVTVFVVCVVVMMYAVAITPLWGTGAAAA